MMEKTTGQVRYRKSLLGSYNIPCKLFIIGLFLLNIMFLFPPGL